MTDDKSKPGGDGGTIVLLVGGKLSGSGSISADGGGGTIGGKGGNIQIVASESDFAGRISANAGNAVAPPKSLRGWALVKKNALKVIDGTLVAVVAAEIRRRLGLG